MNESRRHDHFSVMGLFLGLVGAIVVFCLLFGLAPIFARAVGY